MADVITEAGLDGVAGALADPEKGMVSVPILTDEQLTAVVGLLAARGFGIAHIDTHLPSLDEVFLSITGRAVRAGHRPGAGARAAGTGAGEGRRRSGGRGMSAATATVTVPARAATGEGRIGPRANLRHIGALARRNMLQIKQDPESMFDALLMPVIFTLLFVYVFGGAVSGKGTSTST